MPGLVGFAGRHVVESEATPSVIEMRDLLSQESNSVNDNLFALDGVFATRTHINVIQKGQQPFQFNDIFVWLDGEFFDVNSTSKQTCDQSDAEVLARLFCECKRRGDFDLLKQIDGIYSAVVFDRDRREVSLVTDRYGLRHLYFTQIKGALAWSSETKAFLGHPDFRPTIDRQAVNEFFAIGQLLENRTWFDDVSLVPSGTVVTFDLDSERLTKSQYWWWDQIAPFEGKLDENEIIDELGRIFSKSVERRLNDPSQIGITLSGGLDSRAMLAAMADHYSDPIHVLTFGASGCEDERIAKMAAAKCDAVHHFVEINEDNWLSPRIAGVWNTDGHMDLMHMHGLAVSEFMRDICEINLSGFSGDAILGGSFFRVLDDLDSPIDRKKAAKAFHCSEEIFDEQDIEKFRTARKGDFYLLQNRVRRFTAAGTKQLAISTEQRKPFFDNQLMEFAYSLPDKLRFNSYIYKKMLLRFYPRFFREIPWHSTGVPIGASSIRTELFRIRRAIKKRVKARLFNEKSNHNYTDYPSWVRREPARSIFENMLQAESSLYGEFIDRPTVLSALESHMQGENHSSYLCRCLTFELWLQQVFEQKYRNPNSSDLELVAN